MALFLIGLSSCAKPTQEEIKNANYGSYPDNHKSLIKNYMENV